MLPDRGAGDAEARAQLLARYHPPRPFPEQGEYLRQRALCRAAGKRLPHHSLSSSMEMSMARAEWVRAPTGMISTPVSAMARTVSRLTPPEASTSALPAI